MGRKSVNYFISDFYCTCCGQKGMPLARKDNKRKEPGHLKKLYCIYCKAEKNFCEVRPYSSYTLEDFKFEFMNNNFEDGLRKMTIKQLKAERN